MFNFKQVNSDEVLKDDFIEEYKENMRFFYQQLINLNINIFIIKKIREFPFGILCNSSDTIFFSMVLNNFYENSVITITRLATDTEGDLHTLPMFKNTVRQNIKPKYLKDFSKLLRENKFNHNVRKLFEQARKLRNESIAHIKKESIGQTQHLKIYELEQLIDALNNLLDTISFGVQHLMLPIDYDQQVQHPKGTDTRSDIEKILDRLAANSLKLNLPENHPERWERLKKRMKYEDIKVINEYRKKLGLLEA